MNELKGVHISDQEIEKRFFIFPHHIRKNEIKYLIEQGLLKHWQEPTGTGRIKNMYYALRACGLRPDLIQQKRPELGPTQKYMLHCLLRTTLKKESPSTPYFDFFLDYGAVFPFLFYRIDEFSGRLHTPVTSLPGAIRKNLLINGQPTASIDVGQMQPQLLSKILKEQIGKNQFSQWMDEGLDIYDIIAAKANLSSREAGKDKFFDLTFGVPKPDLISMFGRTNWIHYINKCKSYDEPNKPTKYRNKNHNNLAWMLSRSEVRTMKEIWKKLFELNIQFLTVHDEVIVTADRVEEAINVFHSVLGPIFANYKLKTK